MTNETGGYCAMCDTVWAEPGKCRCITIIEGETRTSTLQEHDKAVWNEAIDACIRLVNLGQEQEIRKLKK